MTFSTKVKKINHFARLSVQKIHDLIPYYILICRGAYDIIHNRSTLYVYFTYTESRYDKLKFENKPLTENKYVLDWIEECAELTNPDKIVWITAEEEQLEEE